MKQIELKKYKFENIGCSKLKALSDNSILVSQVSTEGNQFNDFTSGWFKSSRKLQVEILKKDIKYVVMGKTVLEVREDSTIKILVDIFGPSEVHLKERKE